MSIERRRRSRAVPALVGTWRISLTRAQLYHLETMPACAASRQSVSFTKLRIRNFLVWGQMKRLLACLLLAIPLSMSLASCSFLDRNGQDKAACDELSKLLTTESNSGFGSSNQWGNVASSDSTGFASLADDVQAQVLPKASMQFASQIQSWIDSVHKTQSTSIFDISAGYTESISKFGQIAARCQEVSSN